MRISTTSNRPFFTPYLILMLSICAVRSDILPLDHGIADELDPGDPSPAMEEFFGSRPAAPIPAAGNTTDPIWGVAGKVSPAAPASDGRRRRKVLLVAGVVCGVVGVGLILAGVVYARLGLSRWTGSRSAVEPGSVVRPGWSKSCREIRLGAA